MHAGTISTVYEGDAGPLLAAQAKLAAAMKQQSKVWDDLRAKLGVTSKAYADVGSAAEGAARKGSAAMPKLTAEAERAQTKLASLRQRADELDNRMGKLQTAVGGLSGAFGGAGGAVGALIGGVADLAMSFAAGGPLMAGLALVGAGIAGIGSAWEKSAAQAKEAARESMKAISSLVDELTKANAELDKRQREAQISAFTAGLSPAQTAVVRGAIDTDDALKALRAFEADFGLAEANPFSLSGPQEMTRDPLRAPKVVVAGHLGDPQFNLYADKLQEAYRLLQERVAREASAADANVLAERAEAAANRPPPEGTPFPQLRLQSPFDVESGFQLQSKWLQQTAEETGAALDVVVEPLGELGESLLVLDHSAWGADAGVFRLGASLGVAEEATDLLVAATDHAARSSSALAKSLSSGLSFDDVLDRGGESALRSAMAGDAAGVGAALGAAAGIPMAGVIAQVLADAVGAVTAGFTRVVDRVLSSNGGAALSDAGNVLKSAAPLTSVTGPLLYLPILVSAILTASTHTQRFAQFAEVAGKGLDLIVEPLGFIWQQLLPLAGGLVLFAQAVQPITTSIISLMPLETVGMTLFLAFGSIATAALFAASGLAIMQRETYKVAEALFPDDQFADQIEAADTMADATWEAAERVGNTSWEDARLAATDVLTGLSQGIDEVFDVAETNIPQGYRVPYYDAEVPNGAGGGAGNNNSTTINIRNFTMTLAKAKMAEALREEMLQLRGRSVFQPGGDDDTN